MLYLVVVFVFELESLEVTALGVQAHADHVGVQVVGQQTICVGALLLVEVVHVLEESIQLHLSFPIIQY